MARKILFLDFDGVVNSAEVIYSRKRGDAIDRGMVERVSRVVAATNCKIVISSTWRLLHSLPELAHLLRAYGLSDNGQESVIIGKTPDLDRSVNNRGDEIQAWLNENPDVKDFVILDDESDMGHLLPRLVKTEFKTGMQDIHVVMAIAMLQDPAVLG